MKKKIVLRTPTGHRFGETFRNGFDSKTGDERYLAKCEACSLVREVVGTTEEGHRVFRALRGGALSIRARCVEES